MDACGLIVEYNPFHNGHLYHVQKARKVSSATCIIAVMSGSFLQRGEPAIIDKFHRTKAALASGVDIVLELPYPYAVQSSSLFARGSVQTLHEIGVSSICFGSESGTIDDFILSYNTLNEKEVPYQNILKKHLDQGVSFPKANELAIQAIGLKTDALDLSKPNNILGFSYVRTILEKNLPIKAHTIKRTNNNYHEEIVTSPIASATSIRKKLLTKGDVFSEIEQTIPAATRTQMELYKQSATIWHTWEHYFPLLHYRVMTMTEKELATIHGVDEGLEYRIKQTASRATTFKQWMESIKTKRYTWTRLQRMFVHILTNTKRINFESLENNDTMPYIRLLGLTKTGQTYLNMHKKDITVPIISQLSRNPHQMLAHEEKASNAYYSILPYSIQRKFRMQELAPPIMIDN